MAHLIAAFARRPRWAQLDLAAELDTTSRVIVRHCRQLVAAGVRLEREQENDGAEVYWTWRQRMRVG